MRIVSTLNAGASAITIGIAALAWAAPAAAQQAPVPAPAPVEAAPATAAPQAAPAGETAPDEIVVTGIRQSLQGALNAKRNSAQVLDAISAEDIGKFPDKNVGEALQRVTGVQITRTGGEGSGVSIRGADPALNRVEINGQTALGTGAGGASRAVEFRDIPAEFVSRLEVVKSATADMTEGGLGGTVRIITRRPFDQKEGYLAGSVQGVYNDIRDKVDPKLALIGSKLFADDTIGVLLSGTYEKRGLWYDQARTTGWRQIEETPGIPATQNCLTGRNQANCVDLDNSGFGDFYPDIPRYVINRDLTERYALNGIVEWRPSDTIRAFVEGTYTRGKQDLNSQFLAIGTGQAIANGGVDTGFTVIGPDETTTVVRFNDGSAAPAGVNVNYRNILGSIDRQTFNGQVGADWQFNDEIKVMGRAAYAKSRAYNNEINTSATAQDIPNAVIDYDNDEQAPNIIVPIDVTTPQSINQFQVLRRPRYNKQREIDFKLDAEYTPATSWITSLKIGTQKRDLKVTSELFDGTKTFNGFVAATPGSGNITLSDFNTVNSPGSSVAVVQSTATNAAMVSQIQSLIAPNFDLGDHDFFNTGDLGFDGGIKRWLNLGNAVADAAGIPDPFVNRVVNDTWAVTEKNWASYISAAFEFDAGVPVTGVLGIRVINTKTNSSGFQVTSFRPAVAATPTAPARPAVPGTVTPVSFDGSYTEFLPSLNVKVELVPNQLFARGTATEVIARPSPADLAPRFTVDNVGFTGSRGNPGLQPFRAKQYDLGLEWYISRTSFVSTTFFRKDISSFVDRTSAPEDVNGVLYNVSSPINGTAKVRIDGAEVGGQLAFDFLPAPFDGFGALANYTYAKDEGYNQKDFFTGGDLSFPGLSKHSYNLSGYFENGLLSVRMSYNWRSKYLIAALDRGNNPAFGEAFGQWDASASINLTEKVSVFVEGVNLFHAQRSENANSIYRRNVIETYGRRIYAGVRARL